MGSARGITSRFSGWLLRASKNGLEIVSLMWVAVSVSMVSSAFIATYVMPAVATEVLVGMAGPVVVAVGSIMLMDRVSRRTPEGLTRLLIRAFVSKMVVFGLYVALATVLMSLDVVVFVVSFTVYFLLLYLVETFYVYQLCVSNRTS